MTGPRPLIVTSDDVLLDQLLQLVALAGGEADVVPECSAATRGQWAAAPVILVGADAARGSWRAARRPSVLLVSRDLDDATVWELGVRVGAEGVGVLPDAEAWLTDALADSLEGGGDPAPCVAVIGGRGGAGATTLAIALAAAGVRSGRRTMLVDADPLGGGIDVALGGEGASGARWDAVRSVTGRLSARSLSEALPRIEALTVMTWQAGVHDQQVPPPAMAAVLAAARRGHDLVVVDAPRSLDDAAVAALESATTVLVVVPAEIRATAAAVRVRQQLDWCADVRVVVRGPAPGGLDATLIADSLRLPLAGFIRPEPRLDEAYERGHMPGTRPRSPLAVWADGMVAEIAANLFAA